MAMGLVQMAVAVGIRLPALYIAISRQGYPNLSTGLIIMLAVFSALLGFFMPAGGILDIGGALFRIVLFAVIIMILFRAEFMEALGVVIVAAIIESLIILALSISPVSWLVAGMSPLTIP
ncbi:MAG: hypothetical protein KAW41_02500 [Candidatus Diapherotrites archaeon]|nr:hypothetical protein [Candidatus Diapherotrites archaeon]